MKPLFFMIFVVSTTVLSASVRNFNKRNTLLDRHISLNEIMNKTSEYALETDSLKYRVAIYTGQEYDAENAKEVPYSTVAIKAISPIAEGYNYIFISTPTNLGKPTFYDEFGIDESDEYYSNGVDERQGYYQNTIWKYKYVISTAHAQHFDFNLNNRRQTSECSLDTFNFRLASYTGQEYNIEEADEVDFSFNTMNIKSQSLSGYNYLFFSTPTALGRPIIRNAMNLDVSYQYEAIGSDLKDGYEPNTIWKSLAPFSTSYIATSYVTINDYYQTTEDIEITKGDSYKGWTESGTYIENLISVGGCDSIVMTFLVVCQPENVEITYTGDTIRTNKEYSNYQWYKGSDPINDAKKAEYVIKESGTYYLEITDSNGCSSMSGGITMIKTSVIEIANDGHELYILPNPNNGNFSLKFMNSIQGDYEIQIFNAQGKICHQQTISLRKSGQVEKVNISHLINGIYIIKVLGEEYIQTLKFIKKQFK